jgi:hypothetical protein
VFSFLAILFNVGFGLIESIDAFPLAEGDVPGRSDVDVDNVLSELTGLSDGMESVWLLITSISAVGAVGLSMLTHSVAPIGVYLFSTVFWTSWIRTQSILSVGGYIPGEFLLLITIGMIFLFIAAVIGMLTGSG